KMVRWPLLGGLALVLGAAPGPARAGEPSTLRIASKAFTESIVLAEIAADLARAAGVSVDHRVGRGRSRGVWGAVTSGAIDAYPEYTGTLLDEIFVDQTGKGDGTGEGAPHDRAWLASKLAARGIGMTEPLGFNNTYALGMTAARARAVGVATISD